MMDLELCQETQPYTPEQLRMMDKWACQEIARLAEESACAQRIIDGSASEHELAVAFLIADAGRIDKADQKRAAVFVARVRQTHSEAARTDRRAGDQEGDQELNQ